MKQPRAPSAASRPAARPRPADPLGRRRVAPAGTDHSRRRGPGPEPPGKRRRGTDRFRAGRSPGPRTASGWTLIELVVVVALMSTLVAIAMIGYGTAVTRAREAVLKEDLFRMRDAIDQYYADRSEYPAALQNLVSEGYLRAIPEDPFTRSAATWQTVLAEFDPADPLAQGVFDVRSGASGNGLDGTPYAEW